MPERVFDDFQEFFSLTRPMTDTQREVLIKCLDPNERRSLLKARKSEGWEDLVIQNEIDFLLDQIKEEFKEDLIYIRIQVLSGHVCKIRKAFWFYVNDVFCNFSIRHKWHIFEGVAAKEYNKDWILLVPTNRSKNEQKKDLGS